MLRRARSHTAVFLRHYRHLRRISLKELSERCGISHTKLHYYEHGLRLRHDELDRVAQALECSAVELEGRSDD